jgi:hypothetical protein
MSQIFVVEDPRGVVPGRALREIESLSADITMVRLRLGIRIELPGEAFVPTGDRDREGNLHPHTCIPQLPKFGSVEENPIHEEDAVLWQADVWW